MNNRVQNQTFGNSRSVRQGGEVTDVLKRENPGHRDYELETARYNREGSSRYAFTLIELLVVISIIGLLAALVVPLAGVATSKMRESRTRSELNNLVTAIEGYKLETGEYPADNGKLKNLSASDPLYTNAAAINPLFYELVGCVFTNGQFRSLTLNESVTKKQLQDSFDISGIRNSSRSRVNIDYKGFSVRQGQYAPLVGSNVMVLKVPVPGPFSLPGAKNEKINPWFYDASSTNRHNATGFDLWALITTGRETNIIGNWKE